MIGHLKGKIISKNPPEVLLEVGGIGYEILCPMSTFYQLDNASEDTLLFTHLSIKEDYPIDIYEPLEHNHGSYMP